MELRVKPISLPRPKTTRKREELEAEKLLSSKYSDAKNLNENENKNNSPIQNVTNATVLSRELKAKSKPKFEDGNIHKNHRNRLKQQYIRSGLDSLSEVQKLELLLYYAIPQRDTNPLAHALLNKFGSLSEVLSADFHDLIETNGIKESTALLIKLISGLMNSVNLPNELGYINSSADARAFCSKLYHGVDVEQFYVICLTKSNRIKKYTCIGSGTIDEVNVPIREITQFAIQQKCNQIIVSHNHPSGSKLVSDDDLKFTYSLICSCLLNNIVLTDHVVVGTDGVSSMNDSKIIQALTLKASSNVIVNKETRLLISESSKSYKLGEPDEKATKVFDTFLRQNF